jgi:hypothetical protein
MTKTASRNLPRWAAGLALACALLPAFSPASAQINPNDPLGRGVQRGIGQLNDSGEVGTVTLYRRGEKTLVDIAMHGVPPGKVETAGIYRIADCSFRPGPTPAYALEDLRNGGSSTLVAAPIDKLLSGNYSVVLRSQLKPDHLFACGQLYK